MKNILWIMVLAGLIWAGCDFGSIHAPGGQVEDFNLSPDNLVFNSVGESRKLEVYVRLAGQSGSYWFPKWVDFSSDNPSVADVDQDGVVSATGIGTCNVKACLRGLEREIPVKVNQGWSDPFADEVTETNFGYGAGFGQDYLPDILLGSPEGAGEGAGSMDVVSLGAGGDITLGFMNNLIVNEPGPDFIVFENPFYAMGNPHCSFNETMIVQVSQDGENWVEFPFDYTPPDYPDPDSFWNVAGNHPVYANSSNGIDPTDPAVAGGDAFDLDDVGLDYVYFVKAIDTGHPTYPETRVTDMNGDTVDDYGQHWGCGGGSCKADLDTITAANWTHCQGLILGPDIGDQIWDIFWDYLAGSWHEISLTGPSEGVTVVAGCWPEPMAEIILAPVSVSSSDTTVASLDGRRLTAEGDGTAIITGIRSELSYEIPVSVAPDITVINSGSNDFSRIRSGNSSVTNNVSSTGSGPEGIDVFRDNLFVVMSGDDALWRYDLNDLSVEQEISLGANSNSPQEVLVLNENRAFITNSLSLYVIEVNPLTGEITDEIELPEQGAYGMAVFKDYLFVGMSSSGQGRVYIIKLSTNQVIDDLTSSTPNCRNLLVDEYRRLNVLCEGDAGHPSVVEVFRANNFSHLATLGLGEGANAVSMRAFENRAYLGDGQDTESLLYSIDLELSQVIRNDLNPIRLDPGSGTAGEVSDLGLDRQGRVWALDRAKDKVFVFNLADDTGEGDVPIQDQFIMGVDPGRIYVRPLFR